MRFHFSRFQPTTCDEEGALAAIGSLEDPRDRIVQVEAVEVGPEDRDAVGHAR